MPFSLKSSFASKAAAPSSDTSSIASSSASSISALKARFHTQHETKHQYKPSTQTVVDPKNNPSATKADPTRSWEARCSTFSKCPDSPSHAKDSLTNMMNSGLAVSSLVDCRTV